jgi:hypothetical protein
LSILIMLINLKPIIVEPSLLALWDLIQGSQGDQDNQHSHIHAHRLTGISETLSFGQRAPHFEQTARSMKA